MKKNIHKIHLWLSMPIGLLVTIICITGAILVFETEIKELCNRDRYYVDEIKENTLPLHQLVSSAKASLPDSLAISSLQIYADKSKNYRFSTQGRNGISVYVDPYTGKVRDVYKAPDGNFFQTTMRLHRWFLDTPKRDGSTPVGKTIVGITTILLVLILISGIIIWIPKTGKALKRRLKIKQKKGYKVFFRDLHVAGGIYAALILLTLALTGLTWSFDWYRTGFYKILGADVQQPQVPSQQNKANSTSKEKKSVTSDKQDKGQIKESTIDFSKWEIVSEKIIAANPDFKAINLQNGKVSLSQSAIIGNSRAADNYTFNPQTGEITEVKLYKDQDKANKIRGWIYSVHVGNWGGLFTKIITFLASLLGATLPLTGYYLWLKKYLMKRKKRKNE